MFIVTLDWLPYIIRVSLAFNWRIDILVKTRLCESVHSADEGWRIESRIELRATELINFLWARKRWRDWPRFADRTRHFFAVNKWLGHECVDTFLSYWPSYFVILTRTHCLNNLFACCPKNWKYTTFVTTFAKLNVCLIYHCH